MSEHVLHSGTPPGGTVTLLFSDIEGSTRLLQALGDRYADALMQHREILRAACQGNGGRELDATGDACFLAFDRARDAVAAAIAAQRSLGNHTWPRGTTLRVRMGLHTGEPSLQAGSYVGLDVHRAARICAAGHGGQILLSQTTYQLVQQGLCEGVGLRDLGRHRLKDLLDPEHLFQVIAPGLPTDFPPLRTRPSRSGNLPAPPNELIGREKEIEAVRQIILCETARAITLTGPGGTGKTRLALQVATSLQGNFHDGIYFVALAPIRDPTLLSSSIALALGVREDPARPVLESVTEFLQDAQVLLVLDNFEQLVAAAPVVADLLEACPRVTALITSRVVLHLSREHEYPVSPLPLPDLRRLSDPGALERYAAVALFVQRARAVKPSFGLTSETASVVARICARLDGLPLAIELAAARIKLLPPQAILDRLGSRLDFLKSGARDLPARHQTLRQAIAWSYDLLDDDEKVFFGRISVFVGGCTLGAVETVSGTVGGLATEALDAMAALVDKSLVQQQEGPGDEARFVMLETIREYGLECLRAKGELPSARRAHALYFLALAEQAEAELTGPRQSQWLDRLETEHDNLRAAFSWAEAQGESEDGLRLGAALWRFWVTRTRMREGYDRLTRLLALPGAEGRTSARAGALHGLGTIAHEMSDYAGARLFVEESLSIWRELGDKMGAAKALNSLGWVAFQVGDFGPARLLSEEALQLSRELGEKRGEAVALFNLGIAAYYRSEYVTASSLFEQSLALRREIGDRRGCAYVQVELGWVQHEQGNHDRLAAILGEALAALRELNDKQLIAWALSLQGSAALASGELAQAKALLEESLCLAREVGNKVISGSALSQLAEMLRSQGEIDSAVALAEEAISLWQGISSWRVAPALHCRGSIALTLRNFPRAFLLYKESLALWSGIGARRGVAIALEGFAGLAMAQGKPVHAARSFAAAEALRQVIGAPRPPVKRTDYQRDVATIRRELGEERFSAAWAEGQAMTTEQACRDALAGEEFRREPPER